jgi:uncharacterized protein YjdB
MGWTKNGKSAGTENMNKRIEALRVVLVKKKGGASGATFKVSSAITKRHVSANIRTA